MIWIILYFAIGLLVGYFVSDEPWALKIPFVLFWPVPAVVVALMFLLHIGGFRIR